MNIYHYTTIDRLLSIAEDEEIQPAIANVPIGEIPAVWLSTAEQWEFTASKGIKDGDAPQRAATIAEMIQLCGGLVRIRIDPKKVKLIYPPALKKALRIDSANFAALIRSAKAAGANPNEWRAVAGPVPYSAFLSIEAAKTADPIEWTDLDS